MVVCLDESLTSGDGNGKWKGYLERKRKEAQRTNLARASVQKLEKVLDMIAIITANLSLIIEFPACMHFGLLCPTYGEKMPYPQ